MGQTILPFQQSAASASSKTPRLLYAADSGKLTESQRIRDTPAGREPRDKSWGSPASPLHYEATCFAWQALLRGRLRAAEHHS